MRLHLTVCIVRVPHAVASQLAFAMQFKVNMGVFHMRITDYIFLRSDQFSLVFSYPLLLVIMQCRNQSERSALSIVA